jgi:hypothetical protein
LQARVAAFLASRADVLKSKLLSLVAQKAADDPFKKVKKMIKDLIFKLMEEAREEAEAKGWCDTEMTTNKQTRDKKSADIESQGRDRRAICRDCQTHTGHQRPPGCYKGD